MELGDTHSSDLIGIADMQFRKADVLCDDMLTVLFPQAIELPPEIVQSGVKHLLFNLVRSIEYALLSEQTNSAELPKSWDLLARSALLREPALIDFALARHAEKQLFERLSKNPADRLQQLPAILIAGDDSGLRALAEQLLKAEQHYLPEERHLYRALPAETLHMLCWRIVAALDSESIGTHDALLSKAEQLLAEHDESATAANAALKLAFFAEQEHHAAIANPKTAGLSLFTAGLSRALNLGFDRVLRLMNDDHLAPLAIMLKARGEEAETALEYITDLRGMVQDDSDLAEFFDRYGSISTEDAALFIKIWSDKGRAE